MIEQRIADHLDRNAKPGQPVIHTVVAGADIADAYIRQSDMDGPKAQLSGADMCPVRDMGVFDPPNRSRGRAVHMQRSSITPFSNVFRRHDPDALDDDGCRRCLC